MKKLTIQKTQALSTCFAIAFILFWLFAAGTQLYDFNKFKGEIYNQVFSNGTSDLLTYLIPSVEITVAALLVFSVTRLTGMALSFLLMLGFSAYISLALLNVYDRMPCNCAGLLGQNSSWETNLLFNLLIASVSGIGFFILFKEKFRRKQGMGTLVSHAPLPER